MKYLITFVFCTATFIGVAQTTDQSSNLKFVYDEKDKIFLCPRVHSLIEIWKQQDTSANSYSAHPDFLWRMVWLPKVVFYKFSAYEITDLICSGQDTFIVKSETSKVEYFKDEYPLFTFPIQKKTVIRNGVVFNHKQLDFDYFSGEMKEIVIDDDGYLLIHSFLQLLIIGVIILVAIVFRIIDYSPIPFVIVVGGVWIVIAWLFGWALALFLLLPVNIGIIWGRMFLKKKSSS